jgi:SpoVK/Ycf46/Vps4 family AAA+-type ATPase
MDPAFLRRLPYKIRIGAPSVELYKRIFAKECNAHGMPLSEETFESVVHKIQTEKQLELAAYQPRFLIEQVVGSCRFMQQEPRMERRFLQYAIDNLGVESSPPPPSDMGPAQAVTI